MNKRYRQLAALIATMSLVLGACAGTPGATTKAPTATTPAPAATTPAPAATTPAPAATTPPAASTTAAETTPPPESSAPAESTPPAESTAPAGSETPSPTPVPTVFYVQPSDVPAGATVLRWFCCLGTGDDPSLVKVETDTVNAFNASHDNVKLSLEINVYAGARAALQNEILNGNAPDIVGPVGVGGAVAFNDQWLDLAPLIAKNDYDLTQFQSGAVDFYKIGDVQSAIPFAIYPSMMFYQRPMFEELGLNEPPHKYGEKYKWPDGTEEDWTYDTVKKLALKLTIDKNNKSADEAGFDPTQIVQYGFEPQRDVLAGLGAYFGAGNFTAPDGKTVQIPEPWAASWKYFYDGMWKDHFIMTGPVFAGAEYSVAGNGYAFCSGKVAMGMNFLWSKYCLAPGENGEPAVAGNDWDLAAVPTWKDTPSAVLNADTFRIMKASKHPDEAFEALTYIEGEASKKLLTAYGGMPARPAEQDAFFADVEAGFPNLTKPADWQVARDSVQYADNPNFEAFTPQYNQTLDIAIKYLTKWQTTDGLDMDAEIAALKGELQAAWGQ